MAGAVGTLPALCEMWRSTVGCVLLVCRITRLFICRAQCKDPVYSGDYRRRLPGLFGRPVLHIKWAAINIQIHPR